MKVHRIFNLLYFVLTVPTDLEVVLNNQNCSRLESKAMSDVPTPPPSRPNVPNRIGDTLQVGDSYRVLVLITSARCGSRGHGGTHPCPFSFTKKEGQAPCSSPSKILADTHPLSKRDK